jgi:hypothetical protein
MPSLFTKINRIRIAVDYYPPLRYFRLENNCYWGISYAPASAFCQNSLNSVGDWYALPKATQCKHSQQAQKMATLPTLEALCYLASNKN